MLTAMAFVPGGEVSGRNAMNAAADGVRGLLAGTIGGSDAATAVVGALAPLGFTAEQGVTFLIALGASGFQQILGSSVIWVNNADLAAAASAAIAGLIHEHDLSAAAVGAALDAVLAAGRRRCLARDLHPHQGGTHTGHPGDGRVCDHRRRTGARRRNFRTACHGDGDRSHARRRPRRRSGHRHGCRICRRRDRRGPGGRGPRVRRHRVLERALRQRGHRRDRRRRHGGRTDEGPGDRLLAGAATAPLRKALPPFSRRSPPTWVPTRQPVGRARRGGRDRQR